MEAKNKALEVKLSEEKQMRQDKEQEVGQLSTILDYEQSLFSVVRRAKRETRKWPNAWLIARACIALTKSEEKERMLAV